MAGDWIPVSIDISRKTKILRVIRESRVSRFEAIGLIVSFWAWASEQTADGLLVGNTIDDLIDAVGGSQDFWISFVSVGWLEIEDNGLRIPEFEKWFSQAGKARLQDAQRKRAERDKKNVRDVSELCPESVQKTSEKNVTRGEERREEELNIPLSPPRGFDTSEENEPASPDAKSGTGSSGSACDPIREAEFDKFWSAYPPRNGVKVGKAEARIAFARVKSSEIESLIRAAGNYAEHCRTKDVFPKDAKRFIVSGRGQKFELWREWVEVEKVDVSRLASKSEWKKKKYCPG